MGRYNFHSKVNSSHNFKAMILTVLQISYLYILFVHLLREITYYTCTAIMFAFALKMLWEAWRMGEGELEETQKEVEQELAELDNGQPQV